MDYVEDMELVETLHKSLEITNALIAVHVSISGWAIHMSLEILIAVTMSHLFTGSLYVCFAALQLPRLARTDVLNLIIVGVLTAHTISKRTRVMLFLEL